MVFDDVQNVVFQTLRISSSRVTISPARCIRGCRRSNSLRENTISLSSRHTRRAAGSSRTSWTLITRRKEVTTTPSRGEWTNSQLAEGKICEALRAR